MALYKVPQDVEAEDKLLGPFSFRQFIYLIIVVMAIGIAWGLWQLLPPLAIIPLPIVIFFGALALPLRKDQPMETYLAAMVEYFLKPHRRLWDPDGINSLIEITVPKVIEYSRVKDITTTEAERRFSYLSEIADSQGWSVRGSSVPAPNSAMNSDVYFEAQQVPDIINDDSFRMQSIDEKLALSNTLRRENAVNSMQNAFSSAMQAEIEKPMPSPSNYFGGTALTEPETPVDITTDQILEYNPYPTIQQSVIQPMNQKKPAETESPPTTSEKVIPTAIINLATNTDLTIATMAREANRIQDKINLEQGVVINLR